MFVERINFTDLDSAGFEALPAQIYSSEFLSAVPNKINSIYFHSAFLIPGKGRVVLYDNPGLNFEGQKAFALGHFECINDPDVAKALFRSTRQEAEQSGAHWLLGPMNGSTWDNHRFALSHEAPGFFMEPYHHLYYNQLWQDAGFEIIATYSTSIDKQMHLFEPEHMLHWQKLMDEMKVVIRPINKETFRQEIIKVHAFCGTAFRDNYLFSPITEEEFLQKYLPVQDILDPDLVLMAEDADRELIAVFFAIRDICNKTTPTLIVKTIARIPLRKYAGLIHLMANKVVAMAKRKGYQQMIHAFMHDDNKSNNVSGKFSGELFRKYALYGKKIK